MKVNQMDAVSFLQTLPSESVNLLITDPPYESLEKHRKIGTTTRLKQSKSSSNKWFGIFPNERFDELAENLYRVMSKNSHCYLMCDQETMFVLKPAMERAGFKFWKPIIWDKVCIGMGYHYRARHEYVLFFEKGKRKLNNLGMADILTHKRITKGYPTEKPRGLFEDLISQSSSFGESFCDPFFGSGNSLIAAESMGLEVIGNDISDDAHAHLTAQLKTNTDALVFGYERAEPKTEKAVNTVNIGTIKGNLTIEM